MAELVDASVSNTDAARRAGSTPAPGTKVSPQGGTFFIVSLFVCRVGAINTEVSLKNVQLIFYI